MTQAKAIHWFRRDLRLSDNPALAAAVEAGTVLPVYIYDETPFKWGAASKVWLHHSLQALDQSLGGKLNIYHGDALDILPKLAKQHGVERVCWNECPEPKQLAQDQKLLQQIDCVAIFVSNYLWRPDQVLKDDGSYYKVFTAYKRKAYKIQPEPPIAKPRNRRLVKDGKNKLTIESLKLLPKINWHEAMLAHWKIGEKAAQDKLQHFIEKGLDHYKVGRDTPSAASTSLLSPHLRFGEISPRQIWQTVSDMGSDYAKQPDIECFLSEITWREFSAYLLQHFPQLPRKNFNAKFDAFPWRKNAKLFNAWKKGQTGYPLVDAGMRELWQTGYMHNRVRMVVASFLIKNVGIDWRQGEVWFWDCLFDADLANNSASWQWVAGCGADAAPYFRIFNPTTQGEKFDKQGFYTRQYVPELKDMPDKYLYKPWEAPVAVLEEASVVLGKSYPKPIVDLKVSREAALTSYKSLK